MGVIFVGAMFWFTLNMSVSFPDKILTDLIYYASAFH